MRERSYVIISILLAFVFLCSEVMADPRDQSASQYRRRNYYMKVFSGDWNYTAAIGLNQFNAENSSESKFFKRMGYTGSLSIHRSFSENFAGRWKMNVNSLTKFQLNDLKGGSDKYYPFWTVSTSLDVMYNLKNLFNPYDVDNTLKYWLFFGGGIYHSFAEDSKISKVEYVEKKSKPGARYAVLGDFKIPTIIPMINVGAILQIPLNFNLDLNVELKGVIVPEKFDNEIGGGDTWHKGYEGYGAILFGVTYHM